MIAMLMLGFIITAIYASWSAVVRGSKVGLEAAAQIQRTRMAMRCLVDSLLSIQFFAANQPYYSFIADTSGEYSYLSFVARLPASFPDSGVFGDQVVRRLTFNVEPGPNRQNQLVMYQMPLLLETNAEQKPVSIVLAREVHTFALEFMAPRTNDWQDNWTYTNQLPPLVRITLGLGQANGLRVDPDSLVTRVVALPAIVIPGGYQMAPPMGPPGIPIPGQPGMPIPGQPGGPYRPGAPITTGPPGMRTVGGMTGP